ncbi:MAG: hypothetical protein JNK30_12465 [Phenylobacterium sp.]|uniref:hypothetical protein n=1 Tax=Phenylobacterium sp. TaxID=1871053 RepID=UPI001A4AA41B|nr:hypothetical protein [Phenylobacterium sp.]MBL8772188.1 hypothetical protein [Phenylobacterium sp.]
MTKPAVLFLVVAALSGCGQKPAAESSPASQSAAVVGQDKCARGGMNAANDPGCKAAADERFDKFINGGGDEHRRR